MWTQFWDMHSGGGQKLDHAMFFIEAPEAEAKVIFYNKFGRDPDCITCTCCGEDYAIHEHESLEQATGYQRNCKYKDGRYIEEQNDQLRQYVEGGQDDKVWAQYLENSLIYKYKTLEEYSKSEDVKIVPKEQILSSDRVGEIVRKGYVWMG